MPSPAISPHHKTIAAYYAELDQYRARAIKHELALKKAIQNLLATLAHERKWTLVPELTLDNGKRPDGALEWVIDQYQASTDARSGITSDPNRDGSEEKRQYIARLAGKVMHVSVETVRLVRDLAARVDLLAAVGVAAGAGVEA